MIAFQCIVFTQLMGFCISSQNLDRFNQTVLTLAVIATLMLNHVTALFEELTEFKDYLQSFLWATYAIFMIGLARFLKTNTSQHLWRILERNWNQGNPSPLNLLLSDKIILISRLYSMCSVFQMMQMINNSGVLALLDNSTALVKLSASQVYMNKARYAMYKDFSELIFMVWIFLIMRPRPRDLRWSLELDVLEDDDSMERRTARNFRRLTTGEDDIEMIDFRRHNRPIFKLNLAIDKDSQGRTEINAELGEEAFEAWELFSQRNWVGKCPPVVLINTFDVDEDSTKTADSIAGSMVLLTREVVKPR